MEDHQTIRTYPRAAPEVRLQVRALPDEASEAVDGVIGNVSLGGMFIETDQPQAPGKILRIEFDTTPQGAAHRIVAAKAVVRWHRRIFEPRGMGVQFLDFEGVAEQHLQQWLSSILEKK